MLDIRLPGIDGLEVLAQLRSQRARDDVAVVLCSAQPSAGAADAIRGDRRTSFVAKPFHPDRLIAALDDMLRPAEPGVTHDG